MGPVSSKMERIKVGTHHGTAQLILQPLYHIRYLLIMMIVMVQMK